MDREKARELLRQADEMLDPWAKRAWESPYTPLIFIAIFALGVIIGKWVL